LPNWPVTLTSLDIFPLVAEGVPNSGVVGTIAGQLSAVMHGNGSPPFVLPADPGAQSTAGGTPLNALPQGPDPTQTGTSCTKDSDCMNKFCLSGVCSWRGLYPSAIFGPASMAAQPNTMIPLFAQPSLGDIDQDGTPDVVASGGSINLLLSLESKSNTGLKGDNLLAMWSGKTGAMLPASPMVLEDFTFFNSQAIADLDGDDYPEVITGSGGYFVHAFNGCGVEPASFPKFTGQWVISTAAVGDVDGDHKLELAVSSRDGWLYLWHTEGRDDGVIEWESFHHDAQNTGNYDSKLAQGTPGKKAAKPLTAAMCPQPSSSSSSSGSSSGSPGSSSSSSGATPEPNVTGGCSCRTAEDSRASMLGGAGVLVGLGVFGSRRRKSAKRASARMP
jgi:MYXO-CTERM domain-containing protein